MSATERLKVWLNQQIANILGDLQEREPLEDPSPTRARCRIIFVVSLLLVFSVLLVYTFIDAPDARVVQMHHLTRGDKNEDFPECFLYKWNATKCKKWSKFPQRIPVSCPCTNTSTGVPWRDLVKFYVLQNSMDRNISKRFPWESSPYLLPALPLAHENIVKDTKILTAERFCDLSSLWPIAIDSTTSPGVVHYVTRNVTDNSTLREHCVWMATLLFPGPGHSRFEDRARSTKLLNTPSLLSQEGLNTLLAQLARDSILKRQLALDMALSLKAGNEDFRRFYNALAQMLTELLDRDVMNSTQSYVHGATELFSTLQFNRFFEQNVKVWYLEDYLGPMFLQPEIDWNTYLQYCSPLYCQLAQPMRGRRKLYWAFGILGGVATIVLAVVTMVLWPCTATLLLWISNYRTAATRHSTPPRGYNGATVVATVMLLHSIYNRRTAATRHPTRPVGRPQLVELPSLNPETVTVDP